MNDRTQQERTLELVTAFLEGRVSRRQLLKRAGLLGISLSALAAALSAPGRGFGRVLAQEGGELIVAAGGDIDTTDPHVSQLLVFNNTMRFTCFNGLVKYGPDMGYVGDLAASWDNPDDKTYVFTLKDGLTYHNGQAVEASHVEFSYKRIAEKATVWSGRVANIAAYEVVDAKTIKITLTNVQADFLDGLVPLSIISPEIAETIEETPIGTGPFSFVEWVPNDHISLTANPTYHEEDVPGVQNLSFRIIPEAQVAITNVKSGTIQGILDVPVSQAVPLRESSDVSTLIVPTSGFHLFELLGKNHEAIRTNVKVRQAIAHCLDKDAIQATVFSGEGVPEVDLRRLDPLGLQGRARLPLRPGEGQGTAGRGGRDRPGVHRPGHPGLSGRRARLDHLAGRVGGGRNHVEHRDPGALRLAR
jgi:peptide/nickel transport system substrate-binding protein